MWLTARLLPPILLCVASTGAQSQASSQRAAVYCGGGIEVGTVERYFSDLRQALAESAPNTRFNSFVDTRFGVTNARGKTLYFNLKDVGAVTPGWITVQEWREISRRGSRSLHEAGWRGCFMDHGKVSFQGSKETGLRLSHFSRDMPWVEPPVGDVLP